jgi:hypothetical protein
MIASDLIKDLKVRRCISKAEVARYSFKKMVTGDVEVFKPYQLAFAVLTATEAISVSHQYSIESVGKCLRVFAETQQYLRPCDPLRIANVCPREYAGDVNACAARLVNASGGISGSRIASTLHRTLTLEAQEISTTSMRYVDPESEYPTAPHPIIYGFSLPPIYFSQTPSTKVVVKVFSQMVSCVCEHQGWDAYANESVPSEVRVRDCL